MIELLLDAERSLSFGMVDQAEATYRKVAAADPRNSIAVVGLARVALEREDDAGALVLARRALGIDAENIAAQRLVTRLEEVLRTRGEPLPDDVTGSDPEPTPKPGPDPAPEPDRQPEPDPAPELEPDAGPEPDPAPESHPAPTAGPVRRSWVDRLLRR